MAIVGAGPAGLQTALRLKERGIDATVFEEHDNIGEPEHCSGLISAKSVAQLGIHLGDCLQNEIRGAKIFSPNGKSITIKRKNTVAYVVNRKEFDRMLLRKARFKGIHVATNTKLIDVRNNTLFVQAERRGEIRKADFVVGADGVNSTVRHLMGIKTNKNDFVHTVQSTMTGEFDERLVEVHLGEFAKGLFAWVIPISKDKAKVGLGSTLGENVGDKFREFAKKKLPDSRIRSIDSALVPCAPPLTGIGKANMAIVGDAAFQTKATTGGGIMFGMKAGNILADSIADTIQKGVPLANYEKNLSEINRELRLHWKIHKYAYSLSDSEMDGLIAKLKSNGIEEFLSKEGDMDEPSNFVGKLAKNPRFLFMGGTMLKFLLS